MGLQLAPRVVADIEWAVVSLTGLIAVVSLVSLHLKALPYGLHALQSVLRMLPENALQHPVLCVLPAPDDGHYRHLLSTSAQLACLRSPPSNCKMQFFERNQTLVQWMQLTNPCTFLQLH
jgi:hypothetical protein